MILSKKTASKVISYTPSAKLPWLIIKKILPKIEGRAKLSYSDPKTELTCNVVDEL